MQQRHMPNSSSSVMSNTNTIITTATSVAASAASTTASNTLNAGNMAGLHQRRRKKRPNYGTRIVEVRRGYNGFGFTISGQQPCRLSCIVSESPADQAGLRNGDFLISINGLNVSKLPHETVVRLIGNSFGSIRMQIAENYYSDSSDEENATQQNHHQYLHRQQQNSNHLVNWRGAKPRYLHHRNKLYRMRNSPQKKRTNFQQQQQQQQQREQQSHDILALNAVSACAAAAALEIQTLRPLMEDMPLNIKSNKVNRKNATKHDVICQNNTSTSAVANVSAIVRVATAALEYRAIVGYMGTIEMPKQISHSSKLQTVRSCIRKLRQEKRQPTTVLMIILPDCLRLQAVNGSILASYNSSRLNYVSSSSESENRFFGLITSAVHTSQFDDKDEQAHNDDDENAAVEDEAHVGLKEQQQHYEHDQVINSTTANISISNSCHVFVVDTKICEHQQHVARANEFHIQCTRDPISSLCLEFPNNSEYVVNLIRSMYTMRILPPATRHNPNNQAEDAVMGAAAHSPQPSNHSEISTTTSNSDSGIGFNNDCTNVSDRIVLVDFPGVPEMRMRNNSAAVRPARIFNNFNNFDNSQHSENLNMEKRLAVRAMPDAKTTPTALTRPNLLASFNLIKSPATSLTATRSCDDVLALLERGFQNNSFNNDIDDEDDDDDDDDNEYIHNRMFRQHMLMTHASMDDISLHSTATASTAALVDDYNAFLHPSCLNNRKLVYNKLPLDNISNKLSPQVYCSPTKLMKNENVNNKKSNDNKTNNRPTTPTKCNKSKLRFSIGFKAFDESSKRSPMPLNFDMDTWSSLQNLNTSPAKQSVLDTTSSEPDLGVSLILVRKYPKLTIEMSTAAFTNILIIKLSRCFSNG